MWGCGVATLKQKKNCWILCDSQLHEQCTWFFLSPFSVFHFRRCSRWRRLAATTDASAHWTEQAVLTWQHTNGPGKPPDWHSGFAWPAPEVPWSPRRCCLPVCSPGKASFTPTNPSQTRAVFTKDVPTRRASECHWTSLNTFTPLCTWKLARLGRLF